MACDNDDSGTSVPDGEAVVQGRIGSTTGFASPGAPSSAPAAQAAQNATTVVVGRVNASGSVETVAEGTVEGSAYAVSGVPAGLSSLVVVARDSEGNEVGRALVQGTVSADETVVVSPIDAETTLEAMVLASLRASGSAEAASNTGELAAFVHMSPTEAEATLSSSSRVDLVAEAYQEAEAAITASLNQSGSDLDAGARAELAASIARQYAMQRDGGASLELAHEALVEGMLSAYASAGATDADLVVATAAAATTAINPGSAFEEDTRIEVARQAMSVNLHARERLAAGSTGGSNTANTLANTRVSVSGAANLGELEADLDGAMAASRLVLTNLVLGLVSEFALTVQLDVEAALETAMEAADLRSRLEGRTTPPSAASATATYEADVAGAVEAVADAMPTGVDFDAEAMADLMIAANGSAWID